VDKEGEASGGGLKKPAVEGATKEELKSEGVEEQFLGYCKSKEQKNSFWVIAGRRSRRTVSGFLQVEGGEAKFWDCSRSKE